MYKCGKASSIIKGFFTQLQTEEFANGINEDVVRAISAKRNEPEWMLEFRLKAFRAWLEMEEPHWLKAHYESSTIGITVTIPRRRAAIVTIPVRRSREPRRLQARRLPAIT